MKSTIGAVPQTITIWHLIEYPRESVAGHSVKATAEIRGELLSVIVYNPDRYMADLRTIVAQGRKRIGFLVGAGAPVGLQSPSGEPLIPAVAGLTDKITTILGGEYGPVFDAIKKDIGSKANIESVLSRVRSLATVLGHDKVNGLSGDDYKKLSEKICAHIGKIVNVDLPDGDTPYRHLVNWIRGTTRDHAVEIFTTNYDMLFEQAFESMRTPYFDGFAGAKEPFFDAVSVATNDLPTRWTRLWKLHGSLGWKANVSGEVIRTGGSDSTHLIYPEHLKYDQTQKAPYSALFDRLRAFLTTKDTLLISIGFSYADAHITARIDECLAANSSASVFAFQFQELANETDASAIAAKSPNFSLYGKDRAIINGIAGDWLCGELPTKDWAPIRATYWETASEKSFFSLGDYTKFAKFLALSRSGQAFDPPSPLSLAPTGGAPK